MPKTKTRSAELELMDGEIADKKELFVNLRELEKINVLTGGPRLGFQQIQKLLKGKKGEIHIVDIGFGAGDMLVYLFKNAHKLPCSIKLTGVDLMPETLEYIQLYQKELPNNVALEICDYKDWFAAGNTADIVTANLFCHHLSDKELVEFFKKIKQYAQIGAVINDLHRHPLAYYGIKIPTQLLSKSRFTKNDAPLSVLRGFKKSELEKLLLEAGVENYAIQWKWAFRYIISIQK